MGDMELTAASPITLTVPSNFRPACPQCVARSQAHLTINRESNFTCQFCGVVVHGNEQYAQAYELPKTNWPDPIPVSERLPREGQDVLCYGNLPADDETIGIWQWGC